MRVIAGQFRGRTLIAPKGNATRPTTDRVRESLFSTLASLRGGLDEAVVLDAFAGSGALGIESLSRGAAYAVFVERDRAALQALERNTSFIEKDRYQVVRGDVFKRLPASSQPFDLVFLDPPYATNVQVLETLLAGWAAQGILANEVIVSYEHDAGNIEALFNSTSSLEWNLHTTKVFGDTAIDIYRRTL